ncbi:MAG TPA: zinc ribbon domain-containing protein [Candidatus Angelobacter sp.]|nr:zinc ribbon domain-containing protein [Candidatus Angelobacter sp.]
MFCPACGNQNPDSAGLCSACGKALPSAGLNVAPPPPPAEPSSPNSAATPAPARVYPPLSSVSVASGYPAPSTPQQKSMSVLGMIGIGCAVVLSLVYAFVAPLPDLPNEAEALGYRIGTVFGAIFLPFIIAYPVAGRRKARNPNLFAGIFCGIAFVLLLLNAGGSHLGSWQETTDQKVGRLMREAAGLQPVRHSIFGEDKIDAKLRDFFKNMISLNKEYTEAAGKLDTSGTKNLSTPESFADPDSVADGLKQLHAAYDLDMHQEERVQELMENFKHSFDDLSASDRKTMLDAFDAGLSRAMPVRQRAITAEKAWIDAVDDIYDYCQAHHADFIMSGGHIGITDDQVREEFNVRIRTLNTRRTEFLQAKHEMEEMQSHSFQSVGMSPQQAGVH